MDLFIIKCANHPNRNCERFITDPSSPYCLMCKDCIMNQGYKDLPFVDIQDILKGYDISILQNWPPLGIKQQNIFSNLKEMTNQSIISDITKFFDSAEKRFISVVRNKKEEVLKQIRENQEKITKEYKEISNIEQLIKVLKYSIKIENELRYIIQKQIKNMEANTIQLEFIIKNYKMASPTLKEADFILSSLIDQIQSIQIFSKNSSSTIPLSIQNEPNVSQEFEEGDNYKQNMIKSFIPFGQNQFNNQKIQKKFTSEANSLEQPGKTFVYPSQSNDLRKQDNWQQESGKSVLTFGSQSQIYDLRNQWNFEDGSHGKSAITFGQQSNIYDDGKQKAGSHFGSEVGQIGKSQNKMSMSSPPNKTLINFDLEIEEQSKGRAIISFFSTNQSSMQASIIKTKKDSDVYCQMINTLKRDKKYIMKLKFLNNSDRFSYVNLIPLSSNQNNIEHQIQFYNYGNTSSKIIKGNDVWSYVYYDSKGQRNKKKVAHMELRICIKDQNIIALDRPYYENVIQLTSCNQKKYINSSDYKVQFFVFHEEDSITIEELSEVDRFPDI